jgi:hypothetical protein
MPEFLGPRLDENRVRKNGKRKWRMTIMSSIPPPGHDIPVDPKPEKPSDKPADRPDDKPEHGDGDGDDDKK